MASPERGSKYVGLVLILVANVLAGATYPAQKLALEGLPAASISVARNLLAVLLMALWMRAAGIPWLAFRGREWVRVAILGALAYGLPMHLGAIGVRDASVANASVLVLLEPAMVIVLSWAFLGERLGVYKLAGVGIGLVGAMIIVLEGASLDALTAGEHFSGNVVLALHGILWGCYVPIAKPLISRGRDPVALAAWSLVFSLVILVPAALFEVDSIDTNGPHFVSALGWTGYLALTGSFGATILWMLALRRLAASSTAVFVFVQPLTGVGVGVLVMGETMHGSAILGSVLIILGVALGFWRGRATAQP